MAQLIVRNLDDDLKERLRKRARRHGRSTEEEVREILRTAIGTGGGEPKALGSTLVRRFQKIGLRETIEELRGSEPRPARLKA
jgi:plasmid stability protein